VTTASDGQEVIDLYETHAPDLIFMDMRMPILDGYAATRRIKATVKGQQIPIIALTASAFEHERAQILACGCDDFIRKPLNTAEIFDKISRHLAVHFVYKGQTSELTPIDPVLNLTRDTLQGFTSEDLARLNHAAMAANADEALSVIEELRTQEPAIAKELARLVTSFRFDILMELTTPS
jgi:CheY-like chemotaxis protein